MKKPELVDFLSDVLSLKLTAMETRDGTLPTLPYGGDSLMRMENLSAIPVHTPARQRRRQSIPPIAQSTPESPLSADPWAEVAAGGAEISSNDFSIEKLRVQTMPSSSSSGSPSHMNSSPAFEHSTRAWQARESQYIAQVQAQSTHIADLEGQVDVLELALGTTKHDLSEIRRREATSENVIEGLEKEIEKAQLESKAWISGQETAHTRWQKQQLEIQRIQDVLDERNTALNECEGAIGALRKQLEQATDEKREIAQKLQDTVHRCDQVESELLDAQRANELLHSKLDHHQETAPRRRSRSDSVNEPGPLLNEIRDYDELQSQVENVSIPHHQQRDISTALDNQHKLISNIADKLSNHPSTSTSVHPLRNADSVILETWLGRRVLHPMLTIDDTYSAYFIIACFTMCSFLFGFIAAFLLYRFHFFSTFDIDQAWAAANTLVYQFISYDNTDDYRISGKAGILAIPVFGKLFSKAMSSNESTGVSMNIYAIPTRSSPLKKEARTTVVYRPAWM